MTVTKRGSLGRSVSGVIPSDFLGAGVSLSNESRSVSTEVGSCGTGVWVK